MKLIYLNCFTPSGDKKAGGRVYASGRVLGAGYAFLAPKTYEVSSVLRPAAINELDALNRSEVYKLPPADALLKVGAQLDSYDARLGFFKDHEELFKAFKKPGKPLSRALRRSTAIPSI